jgi:hypothetical protein
VKLEKKGEGKGRSGPRWRRQEIPEPYIKATDRELCGVHKASKFHINMIIINSIRRKSIQSKHLKKE